MLSSFHLHIFDNDGCFYWHFKSDVRFLQLKISFAVLVVGNLVYLSSKHIIVFRTSVKLGPLEVSDLISGAERIFESMADDDNKQSCVLRLKSLPPSFIQSSRESISCCTLASLCVYI